MDFTHGEFVVYETALGAPSLNGALAVFGDGTTIVAGNGYNWVIGDFQAV